jgi:hypothetical protein
MDCRVKPGNDVFVRSRDAATHPSFAHANKSQVTPLKKEKRRREAERR